MAAGITSSRPRNARISSATAANARLRPADEVHLVDEHGDLRHAEHRQHRGVAAGVLAHALAGIDHQQGGVGAGGAGHHVAQELDVAGRIEHHVVPGRALEEDPGRIDRDALVAFVTQGVEQEGVLERLRRAAAQLAHLVQLAVGQRAGVRQQAPHDGALAVVHVPHDDNRHQAHDVPSCYAKNIGGRSRGPAPLYHRRAMKRVVVGGGAEPVRHGWRAARRRRRRRRPAPRSLEAARAAREQHLGCRAAAPSSSARCSSSRRSASSSGSIRRRASIRPPGSFARGSGFALGARLSPPPAGRARCCSTRRRPSPTEAYKVAQFTASAPRLGGAPVELTAGTRWYDYTQEDFFGLGADTSRGDRVELHARRARHLRAG